MAPPVRKSYTNIYLPESAPDALYERLSKKYNIKTAHDVWGLQNGAPTRKVNEPSLTQLQHAVAHELVEPAELVGAEVVAFVAGQDVVGKIAALDGAVATLELSDGSLFDTDIRFVQAQADDPENRGKIKQLVDRYKNELGDYVPDRSDWRYKSKDPKMQQLLKQRELLKGIQHHLLNKNYDLFSKPKTELKEFVKNRRERNKTKPPDPPPVVAPEPTVPGATQGPEAPPVVPKGSTPIVSGSKKAQALAKPKWEMDRADTNSDWAKLQPLLKQPNGAAIWLTPGKVGATIRPKGQGFDVTLMELRAVPMGKASYMDPPQILEMLSNNPEWKSLDLRKEPRMASLLETFSDVDWSI